MFVILCSQVLEHGSSFGYGPFETRAQANEWLIENAFYSLRVGNQPCDGTHTVIEIFRANPDGGIG